MNYFMLTDFYLYMDHFFMYVIFSASKKTSEKSPSISLAGAVGGGGSSSSGGSVGAAGGKTRIPGSGTPGTPRKNLTRRR